MSSNHTGLQYFNLHKSLCVCLHHRLDMWGGGRYIRVRDSRCTSGHGSSDLVRPSAMHLPILRSWKFYIFSLSLAKHSVKEKLFFCFFYLKDLLQRFCKILSIFPRMCQRCLTLHVVNNLCPKYKLDPTSPLIHIPPCPNVWNSPSQEMTQMSNWPSQTIRETNSFFPPISHLSVRPIYLNCFFPIHPLLPFFTSTTLVQVTSMSFSD